MSLEIFYDGDCIFCKSYVRMANLREAAGDVDLISIRGDDPRIAELERQGYELNAGMAVRHENRVYYGAEAMHFLGRLEDRGAVPAEKKHTTRGLFYTLLYPAFVQGRNATLFLLGRSVYRPDTMRQCGKNPAPRSYRIFRLSLITVFYVFLILALLNITDANGIINAINAWRWPRVTGVKSYTIITGTIFSFGVALVFFKKEQHARKLFDGVVRGNLLCWMLYICLGLMLVNFLHSVGLRRLIFCMYCLPVASLAFGMAKRLYRDERGGFLPALLMAILGVNLAVPGLYLPPFVDGIAGWTDLATRQPEYVHTSYKLVRDDGAEIDYSHTLYNPITQQGRFEKAFLARKPVETYVQFMMENYKRLWPGLMEKGLLPHEAVFGQFGYPPHTVYRRDLVYQDFPPGRITELRKVTEIRKNTGELISREIHGSYTFN